MTRCWAIVPAAGSGSRFGSALPKQYAALGSSTVLETSIAQLLASDVESVVVAFSANDLHWRQLPIFASPRVMTCVGGGERYQSVLSALRCLDARAANDDWVMVHDAARPCVRRADIEKLVAELGDDKVGGLLATPVGDTLKRTTEDRLSSTVSETVDRSGLWAAMTPQMFRYGLLRQALENSGEKVKITDEASAIEAMGLKPRLVEGQRDNIKITYPGDLDLAEAILLARRQRDPDGPASSGYGSSSGGS